MQTSVHALRWAQSVHAGLQAFNPELLPDVYRVQAEAHENLGQWSRAADRYQRFVDLWAVADDAHRPQVEEAQRRLDVVLGRLADEG